MASTWRVKMRWLVSGDGGSFNPLERCRSTQSARGQYPAKFRYLVAAALLVALGPWASFRATAQQHNSSYTAAQAHAGKTVFEQYCAVCHGQNLRGNVGPALAGKQFLSVSQFQKLTADYFFHFMSKHMPQNAPGSLTKAQYLDVLAYILSVNGYPSGSHDLTSDDAELTHIKIEPQG